MSSSFNTTVSNWQGVDDTPDIDKDNLVNSNGIFEFVNSKNTNVSELFTPTIANNDAYIDNVGNVASGGSAFYTEPFSLPSGYTIVAFCKGYKTNVSIISEVITAGSRYTPLVISEATVRTVFTYSNTSNSTMNIALSGLNNGGLKAYIVHNEEIDRILSRILLIENTLPDINKCCKNFVSVAEVNSYTKGVVLVRAYATQEFLTAKGATSFYLSTGYYQDNGSFYIQLKKNRQQENVDIELIQIVGSTAPTGIYEWHYRDQNNQFDIHIVVDCSIISSLKYTGLKVHFADMSFIEQSENGAIQNIQNTKSIDNTLEISELKNTITPTIANSNAYITKRGRVADGGGAFYTEPITLPSRHVIIVKAKSYLTEIAIISEVVNAGSQYNPLVIGIDSTIREYSYTNNTDSDLQIALSGLNSGGLSTITIINIDKLAEAIPFVSFDKTTQYPLVNPINETMDMLGIVKDWGFIGDSLNSGEIYYTRTSDNVRISGDMYAWSWGQNICQLCRTIGTNFSVGGLTAKSWIARYWNTSNNGYKTGGGGETFNANPKQVYTICLGTNEVNAMINGGMDAEARAAYIGSWDDVDINDFSNNADTFYGNYSGIIQRIKSIQPSAKIFLINIFSMFHGNDIRLEINAAISEIHSHFTNTFLVDMETLAPVSNTIIEKYRFWGHLTVQGYMWLSYVIGNIINRIIRENMSAFNSLPFIGVEGKDDGTL